MTDPWHHRAACLRPDVDPDDFYADIKKDPLAIKAAKKVCAECPVALDCLRAALAEEADKPTAHWFGVRAGMTEHDRRRLVRGAVA